MEMFVFTGIIFEEAGSFTALCPELDVASQGETPAEAKAMLIEAASLHLQGAIEDGLPYLRPIPADEDPRKARAESIVEVLRLKVDVAIRVYA
jgi:predicted RNase H-like HicB family nuclease